MWVVLGVMLLEVENLAMTLPIMRHLIELIRSGLFPLIEVKVEKQVCPKSPEKIIRVPYTTVRDVAKRVISRTQVLVYTLAILMTRCLE